MVCKLGKNKENVKMDLFLKNRIGQLNQKWTTIKWFLGRKATETELEYIKSQISQKYGEDTFLVKSGRKYVTIERIGGMPNRMITFGNKYIPEKDSKYNTYADEWKNKLSKNPIDYSDPDWYNEWVNDGWN